MAFCTTCGATVQGAFCQQCGTPVSAGGQGAPPPAPASQPYQEAAPPAAKRKMSPLVLVLIIVGGLIVLGGIGIVGAGFFVFHKVKQAGLDPELAQRNPAYAAAKMIVAMNPDLEEVSHDEAAGTITIREKSTGKTTTLGFSDIKNGKLTFSATDEQGKTATVDIGGGAGDLPSWVPVYPGATAEGSLAATGDGEAEVGGTVTFRTTDSPAKVAAFYQQKAAEAGLSIKLNTNTPQGGMLAMTDAGERRSLHIVIGAASGGASIGVTYAEKK